MSLQSNRPVPSRVAGDRRVAEVQSAAATAPSLPAKLGVVRLDSLRRSDGTLMSSIPVTIVSPQHQLRLQSGFGCLASGPLSALQVPAGFRMTLDRPDDAQHAFALSLLHGETGTPHTQRDLLPSRVPIAPEVFAALLACLQDAPWVRAVAPDSEAGCVLRWMHEDAAERRARCQGRLVSRVALRDWIGLVTASEDALIALETSPAYLDFAMPALLASPSDVRRFSRVTGYGPRRYVREYRVRRALAAKAAS
jgi:hypothetical protein